MMQDDRTPDWERLLRLLAPFHDEARGLARRLAHSAADGDDLFQDGLLRAYEKLSTLREEDRFRSWFYAVLLSVHRTRSRRAFWKRFLSLDGERSRGYEPAGEDGARFAEEEMGSRRAARALSLLPAVQREAVILFELEDVSVEEISELQGVSKSAVKSRIARGRDRLRRHYESLGFRDRSARPVRRKRKAVSRDGLWRGDTSNFAWIEAVPISPKEKRHD